MRGLILNTRPEKTRLEERLKELGIELPHTTSPIANYVNAVRTGNLLFLAGKGPGLPGKPLPNGQPGTSLYCAVIVKRVDEQTRSKTSINELLRD